MAIHGQSVDDTLARLVSFSSEPAKSGDAADAGAVLKRGWFYLASDAAAGNTVSELVQGLMATATITNPKANNKEYAGIFVVSKIEANDENELGIAERAPSIIQTLTRVLSPADYTALAAITPVVMQKNEILHIFEVNEGERDLLGLKWNYLSPDARSAMMAITDADLETTGATYVPGISYDDRVWDEAEDKSCSLYVLFRKTAWIDNVANVTAVTETWIPNIGKQEEQEIKTWPNIGATAAQNIYDDAKSNYSNMANATYEAAPAGHKLRMVKKQQGAENIYNVERVTYKPAGSSNIQWPPGEDESNSYFTMIRYRRIRDEGTGSVYSQKRTWVFDKRVKYCVTLTEANNFLTLWTNSVYSASAIWPERGTDIFQIGTDGLKWKAVFIYQNNDSGWETDSNA